MSDDDRCWRCDARVIFRRCLCENGPSLPPDRYGVRP